MRTIRYERDGIKECHVFPSSTRDLRRLFICFGLHAFPVKYGGKYDICFPSPKEDGGPIFVPTGMTCVDGMTLKGWLEFATKQCPDKNKGEVGIIYREMLTYINKETLT